MGRQQPSGQKSVNDRICNILFGDIVIIHFKTNYIFKLDLRKCSGMFT